MPFTFDQDLHQRYYKALADAIKLEFNFTKQVASGQVQGRQDVVDKFLKTLNNSLGLVGSAPIIGDFISFGVELVNTIGTLIQMKHSRDKDANLRGFAESLTRCDSSKQYEMYINNIAREITYRYGCNLEYLIYSQGEEGKKLKIIDTLAHVAALRIMFYALCEGISIENCEALVNGLIDGYAGIQGEKLTHLLNKISIFERITGSKTAYSAESFYARCGFMVPIGEEYQYFIDRNTSNLNKSNKLYVSYEDNSIGESQSKRMKSVVDRDVLVPKYGYAMSFHLPQSNHYPEELGRHFPTKSRTNSALLACLQANQCQFVSLNQIETYLRSANGRIHTIDFTTWLKKQYPALYRGESLFPIFRGILSEDSLQRKGLSFSHGLFNKCDFSFCSFQNISFTRLQHCLVIESEFRQCLATEGILNGSDFTLAKIIGCNFQKLNGILYANFAHITNSAFDGSNLVLQFEGAYIDPATVDSFVACTTNVSMICTCLSILLLVRFDSFKGN
jgi:hypothetical protein